MVRHKKAVKSRRRSSASRSGARCIRQGRKREERGRVEDEGDISTALNESACRPFLVNGGCDEVGRLTVHSSSIDSLRPINRIRGSRRERVRKGGEEEGGGREGEGVCTLLVSVESELFPRATLHRLRAIEAVVRCAALYLYKGFIEDSADHTVRDWRELARLDS